MELKYIVEFVDHGYQKRYVSLRKARAEALMTGFPYVIYEVEVWRLKKVEERL
jgi:hypothetical protein